MSYLDPGTCGIEVELGGYDYRTEVCERESGHVGAHLAGLIVYQSYGTMAHIMVTWYTEEDR